MSFRLKIIIGVALIQGTLLLLLTWSSVQYLIQTNQQELAIRNETLTHLIAEITHDAVLTGDLERLDRISQQAILSPEIIYLRIIDMQARRTLIETGAAQSIGRPFVQDTRFEDVDDGIFDTAVMIREGNQTLARVELGLSISHAVALIEGARNKLLAIAAISVLLVTLLSYFLGTWLTRGLTRLRLAAGAIANGEFGRQVEVLGDDELADAGRSFNTMSRHLAESQEAMQRSMTESQHLMEVLKEKDQRLTAILTTAVDGFITLDAHGIIDDINPAGAALFGYTSQELLGRNVSCLMPEPDHSHHNDYLRRYLAGGERKIIGIGREVTGLRKDGSTFPLDLAVSEMRLNGQPMFVGLVRDISERRQIEAAARRSAAMMAALVNANLDALVTIDMQGRIVEFSPQAEAMFGLSRDEVLGNNMAERLIPAELRDRHTAGMARYTATGEGPVIGQRIEVSAMRGDGSTFPVELTVQVIKVDGDTLFTAFLRDISERKAAEAQLQEAKLQAETASEAKSRFLAHMSHEIRSPLSAVLGSVELLLDETLSQEQRLYAKTAQSSGKILLSLINDILDFSRIEAGELQLERRRFNLDELLSDVAGLVSLHTHNGRVQTAIAVAPGIDQGLIGDPLRLRQILSNLMDNALKFTEHGAVTLTVSQIDKDTEPLRLRFTVTDTGSGIPASEQAHLFEEFQQMDSTDSTLHGGTGLGLAICWGLCQAMGGTIQLESEPGRGSRFQVDIPFDPASPADSLPMGVPRTASQALATPLLIVGLHPLVRQALALQCSALQYWGSQVPVEAAVIDASLPAETLATLPKQLGTHGVRPLILVSPAIRGAAIDQVKNGDYDELLVMPLMPGRLAALLAEQHRKAAVMETSPSDSTPAAVSVPVERRRQPRERILLAEDSPANQVVAQAMLKKAGYSVDVVTDGRQALEAYNRGGYALILMDLRMPGMDGLTATATIRRRTDGKRIPIIAMTANARKEDVERCLAAGMNDFIAKPVDRQKLLTLLQRYLSPSETGSPGGSVEASADNSGAGETQLPLRDPGIISALSADTSATMLPMMMQTFVDEIADRVQRITDGLDSLPMAVLEDEAHTLKSCAGTFGALRLQALAREVETACREGRRAATRALAEKLHATLQDTLSSYRASMDYPSNAAD